MPDNMSFTNSFEFYKDNMLPVGDEEVNAIWGRMMARNVAANVGTWTKVVLDEFTFDGNIGRKVIDLSALGYTIMPAVDLYQLRGGTLAMKEVWVANGSASSFLGCWAMVNIPTSELILQESPNYETGVRANFLDASTREQFGTFLYRLRGGV